MYNYDAMAESIIDVLMVMRGTDVLQELRDEAPDRFQACKDAVAASLKIMLEDD